MSMPGSLFPRSPSLVPDEDRHVRFESDIRSPPPTVAPISVDDSLPGPSRRHRLTPAVKVAVDRFHIGEADAGPSILLPSPATSPAKIILRDSPRDKGKGRLIDLSFDENEQDGDTSGELRVRGKQRELIAARAEQREHEKRRTIDEEDVDQVENEKAHDKARIRMLEGEISRLKEEVRYPYLISTCLTQTFAVIQAIRSSI